MPTNATLDSRKLWLMGDVERLLTALNVTLTEDYRRGLGSMLPGELAQLIRTLEHASPFNATSCLVQSLTAAYLRREDEQETSRVPPSIQSRSR